jgi:hypothetical protein
VFGSLFRSRRQKPKLESFYPLTGTPAWPELRSAWIVTECGYSMADPVTTTYGLSRDGVLTRWRHSFGKIESKTTSRVSADTLQRIEQIVSQIDFEAIDRFNAGPDGGEIQGIIHDAVSSAVIVCEGKKMQYVNDVNGHVGLITSRMRDAGSPALASMEAIFELEETIENAAPPLME